MRHTRNLQLWRLTHDRHWKDTYNLPILNFQKYHPELDPTFKWHRNFEDWGENWIEFNGDDYSYGTCIHVKDGLGSYKPEKIK